MPTIQKELEKLDNFDILDISEKIDDYLVPVEVAAKMKGVSETSIRNAINRGILRRVDGITLNSLKAYKVDSSKRTNGKIRGMKIMEKKIKELEKGKEIEDNENKGLS